jgi:hypothetical protein
LVLILVMILMPKGIIGALADRLFERKRARE